MPGWSSRCCGRSRRTRLPSPRLHRSWRVTMQRLPLRLTARGARAALRRHSSAAEVRSGAFASFRQRSGHFRSAPINGRHQTCPVGPVGATTGLMQRSKSQSYSISSSAMLSKFVGTVRPSVLAVPRLMTSSNFVGCSMGKAAGLAPFKILST